jgi:hypothetical protein
LCSSSGRGIPDIAAQAIHIPYFLDGEEYFLDGTSCATPVRLSSTLRRPSPSIQLIASLQTVAGIISLLNDFLISEGKDPLGFLNPWLYGNGLAGLNDIKSGSSVGCGGGYGFNAVQGWDPVRSSTRDFYFRRWLTLGCIGHGSWNAGLFRTTARTFSHRNNAAPGKPRTSILGNVEHQRYSSPHDRFSLQFLDTRPQAELENLLSTPPLLLSEMRDGAHEGTPGWYRRT